MQLTALALWLNTAFAGFDEAVATAIHQLYVAAGWFFTPFLSFISLLGKGGIFLILLSIVLMLFRKTRRYGTTMLLALAIGALVTNVCFKPLVARPRPYTHDGSIFQQYWEMLGKHTESDKSFPSGHMTAAMAASLAVFLRGNKKVSWTALLFALAMGVSRIYLSVHYATDVLGGVITGSIGGFAGYAISNRIPESFYTADLRDGIGKSRAKKSGGQRGGSAAAAPGAGRRRSGGVAGAVTLLPLAGGGQRHKRAALVAQPRDLQQMAGIVAHGLHVLEHPHMLGGARRHAPEQANFALPPVDGEPADPRPVQLPADPGLKQLIVGGKLQPQRPLAV